MSELTAISKVNYSLHKTPLGPCLIGMMGKEVCFLSLGENKGSQLNEMQAAFKSYTLVESVGDAYLTAKNLFNPSSKFIIKLKGTDFQIKVWRALMQIPFGTTVCYEEVALMIGQPKATRAVASAIAKNNISYIIPCHRVIRKSGAIHKYRWGSELKKEMLKYERSWS